MFKFILTVLIFFSYAHSAFSNGYSTAHVLNSEYKYPNLSAATVSIFELGALNRKSTKGDYRVLPSKRNPFCSSQIYKIIKRTDYSGLRGAHCTGVLVSPIHVLTAGHCLEDDGSCPSASLEKAASFVFGLQEHLSSSSAHGVYNIPKEKVYKCSEVVAHDNSSGSGSFKAIKKLSDLNGARMSDFALIRLDRPVVGIKPISSFKRVKSPTPMGRGLFTIGHPVQMPQISMEGKVVSNTGGALITNIPTFGGHSGGPVWGLYNGRPVLEGLLVSGYTSTKYKDGKECLIAAPTNNSIILPVNTFWDHIDRFIKRSNRTNYVNSSLQSTTQSLND